MDTEKVTLTYLTNPIYNLDEKKTSTIKCEPSISKNEIKFYRKRINALSRNLMKGEVANDNVKAAHDDFIKVAIEYFKFIDTEEILQTEYDGCDKDVDAISDAAKEFSIEEANDCILSKQEPSNTLDNYVTIKTIKTSQTDGKIKHPQRRKINLHSEELRYKGVKSKKKENVNK